MKILFYSTKDFEQTNLEAANTKMEETTFIEEALSLQTVDKSKGFDVISIFAGDDASSNVLEELFKNEVKFIAIRAVLYANVDINKATEPGIVIANVPEYSRYAIAEHAVALIFALNKKIAKVGEEVQTQIFTTCNLVGFDLHGKTVIIIGVGKTGSVFAKIMHGFGCRLLGHDIKENTALQEKYGLEYVDLPVLCRESNIISIHTGLTPQINYLLSKKLIDMMQRGTMHINTSHGGCMNTADVIEGLENGNIGYYGADAYENERGVFFYDHSGKELKDDILKKLLIMPNVMITPIHAIATQEALTNIAAITYYNIDCWKNNQHSKNELKMQGSFTGAVAYIDDEKA